MTSPVNITQVLEFQKARKEATRQKVLDAMQTIEREISESGFYQENDGKVNLTEVARRANISVTTIRNRHHHETRSTVHRWLLQLKDRAPTARRRALSAARDRIAWYEAAMRKMNAEVLKARLESVTLAQENERLRNRLAVLTENDEARVVGIRSRTFANDRN